ncbi:MAG: class I SAM-dependent methyltransferase [Fibrobacter sp.]|nr:class I SAM-dependent methyltransferase [Fibrobacter sp.]
MKLMRLFSKCSHSSVCPAEYAGGLDSGLRRKLQNPSKFLKPFIHKGMSVLDLGCGSGFCVLDIAKLLNGDGCVVGADLQQEMLDLVCQKLENFSQKSLVTLHKCSDSSVGLNQKFDFILMFFMFHEMPNQHSSLSELKGMLNSGGKIMIVEPIIHVNAKRFNSEIELARSLGFTVFARPKIFFSRAVVLECE